MRYTYYEHSHAHDTYVSGCEYCAEEAEDL